MLMKENPRLMVGGVSQIASLQDRFQLTFVVQSQTVSASRPQEPGVGGGRPREQLQARGRVEESSQDEVSLVTAQERHVSGHHSGLLRRSHAVLWTAGCWTGI